MADVYTEVYNQSAGGNAKATSPSFNRNTLGSSPLSVRTIGTSSNPVGRVNRGRPIFATSPGPNPSQLYTVNNKLGG
jgi:hypothetical protein